MNLNVNVKVDLEFLLDFFSLFAVFHVSLAISARLEFGMLRYSSRHNMDDILSQYFSPVFVTKGRGAHLINILIVKSCCK